jgi:hypothetical protein
MLYDEGTLALDREFFNKIRKEYLPQDGSIYFIRHHNFEASFKDEHISQLEDICYKSNQPDFEFLIPELETIKLELIQSIEKFICLIGDNTFHVGKDRSSVDKDLESDVTREFLTT